MTERIQSLATSSESLDASGVDSASRGAMDQALPWGYVAICLLAVAAAIVIARDGASNADLGLATVVIDAVPVFQDICTSGGDQRPGPAEQTCPNQLESTASASGVC